MKKTSARIIKKIKALSLGAKIGLGTFLVLIGIAGVFAGPIIKDKLTAPAVYTPSSPNDFVPPAHKEPEMSLLTPGSKALLPGTKWIPQSFNNCGPATTAMVLAYFGHSVSQNVTKQALRTNDDDKNVFTYEMQSYMRDEFGVDSKLMFNGDLEIIKKLVTNGFYVIVEDWLHPNEDIGHVTIIRGFDDEKGVLIADDSYIGIDIVYKYDVFDKEQWKAFNREYVPVYLPEQEEKVKAIIGENWDERTMYEGAVKRAEAEIAANDRDMYAYFNLGTSYYALEQYDKAWQAFEKAKAIGWPRRMLWYQIQPVQTLIALGRFQEALALADEGLWANDSFAELHVEKALAYKGLGDLSKAREEVQKALQYSPNLQSAKDLSTSF